MSELTTYQSSLAASWPSDGTRLAEGVESPYFLPVTEEILAEITRRVVVAVHPEKVILFGSFAYGTPHPDSDVDLLVIADIEGRPAQRAVLVDRAIRPRPFPMDILVKTPAEVALAVLAKGDYFVREILEKGRVLYERPK
jgi:predicted nucleotidyltransferase